MSLQSVLLVEAEPGLNRLNEPAPPAAEPKRAARNGGFSWPGGTADLRRGEVHYPDGQCAVLSERELALLRFLAANSGRVISRDEILRRVWRWNPRFTLTRTIDMHIVHLRQKLRDDAEQPQVLLTIRGEGYLFTPNGS